jgi:hypothetical protein
MELILSIGSVCQGDCLTVSCGIQGWVLRGFGWRIGSWVVGVSFGILGGSGGQLY